LVVEREWVETAASVAGVGFTALVAEIRIFAIFFLVQEVGIFAIFVLVAEVSIFTIFVETFFTEQARADGIHGARQQFAGQVDDDFLRSILTDDFGFLLDITLNSFNSSTFYMILIPITP